MKCVIADDSRIERARVRQILQSVGHTVVAECENGELAVNAVREHTPDLVVLDVVMPRMTGDAAGLEIATFSRAAIVFATKNSQGAIQQTAARIGAVISVKPYDPGRFMQAVEQACGNRR